MDELLSYLPGTDDNLLFLTLAVLVLLMITGIYGYLSTQASSSAKRRWGWPTLSLFALAILLFWFGQPLSEGQSSQPGELVILISQFLTGLIVLGSAAASVLSSDLKWSLTAAIISFLTSGLLFLQTAVLPVVLLCWLISGGSVILFLWHGVTHQCTVSENTQNQIPFREPFLSCLVCGLLLCSCLWVVHREWGPKSTHEIEAAQTTTVLSTVLIQQLLTEHWPTFILLMIFIAVLFAGVSHLLAGQTGFPLTMQDHDGENF